MKKWIGDGYWVSRYNYAQEYRSSIELPDRVEVHDATLRDGEQTPGVFMSKDQKVEIAQLLDTLGVERIEAGMPAVSTADFEAIKQISSMGLKARVYSFARAINEDIDAAKEAGADGVVIETPLSEPKMKYQFPKWTDKDVIEKSVATCAYAKSLGLDTVYFGYDTTRADPDLMDKVYTALLTEAKPDSIGIVDTVGCAIPNAVYHLIKRLRSKYDVKFEIHTHNDFGMGVASSFAALEAGAQVIHTCLNGLGERTGNASLEQIMMGLKILYGYDNDYRLDQIKSAAQQVAQITKKPILYNTPFTGEHTFSRESGIGVEFVKSNPIVMFAIDPAIVGNSGCIILGKGSGVKSVRTKMQELGVGRELSEDQERELLARIKKLAIQKESIVTDGEFLEMLGEL
jgi:isopropylmalate/homocitrate/citramalate synthase